MRVNRLADVVDHAVVDPRDVGETDVNANALRQRETDHDREDLVHFGRAAGGKALVNHTLEAFANGEHGGGGDRESEHRPHDAPPVRAHERPHELQDGKAGTVAGGGIVSRH